MIMDYWQDPSSENLGDADIGVNARYESDRGRSHWQALRSCGWPATTVSMQGMALRKV